MSAADPAQVEALLERLDALPDPGARAVGTAAVEALVGLYGAALDRVMALVGACADPALAGRLADDALVGHLLLVHDLHPRDAATRVADALEALRPYLRSHGGGVELLAVADDGVRLRYTGSCRGGTASTATLRAAIERAVREAAPEIERIETEGAEPGGPAAPPALVQLTGPRRADAVRAG